MERKIFIKVSEGTSKSGNKFPIYLTRTKNMEIEVKFNREKNTVLPSKNCWINVDPAKVAEMESKGFKKLWIDCTITILDAPDNSEKNIKRFSELFGEE